MALGLVSNTSSVVLKYCDIQPSVFLARRAGFFVCRRGVFDPTAQIVGYHFLVSKEALTCKLYRNPEGAVKRLTLFYGIHLDVLL
jgi:hypothetical protein